MKGRSIKPMDLNGKCDPYVKVTLLSSGREIARKRSSVKMKCIDPVWNEAMVFEIESSRIKCIQILFTLMDYNHYMPNKTIGRVSIGSKSTDMGIKHYIKMLSNPGTAIAMWHTVVKK